LVAFLVLLFASGCTGSGKGAAAKGDEETTPTVSYGMAGKPIDLVISRAALESTPTAPLLDTPEHAIRSYLDWVSYSYRVGQSQYAQSVTSPAHGVAVDAYNEYNLQSGRIIDQELQSITFGKASVGETSTIVPAEETWRYRYLSTAEPGKKPGKQIAGPYTVTYDSEYTLIKTPEGWVVDAVKAEPQSEVK
jgi:hypothetical protein